MGSDGKDFEALIGWIVKTIHPGARVTPDARLPDVDGGDPRQIDVLIELTHGQLDLTIIGEVRDRACAGDVTWVEQVKAKRESVRAQQAFMVSAAGFSDLARRKAEACGVQLLALEEATTTPWVDRIE